jgi:hypothetical protein
MAKRISVLDAASETIRRAGSESVTSLPRPSVSTIDTSEGTSVGVEVGSFTLVGAGGIVGAGATSGLEQATSARMRIVVPPHFKAEVDFII